MNLYSDLSTFFLLDRSGDRLITPAMVFDPYNKDSGPLITSTPSMEDISVDTA